VLAARGARLSLVGLEPGLLAEVCGELGEGHVWFEADVTDQGELERAVGETVAGLGGIDAVIANAGIAPVAQLSSGDPEVFARAIDVNLTGVMRTIRATAPHVIASRGYFLIVSSASAYSPVPAMAVYAATKAGVESLANSLRVETKSRGVAVGSAHPCWIDTDMVRDADAHLEAFRRFRDRLPWPLHSVTSVEKCAEALAAGVEKRKRRINVPRSIGLIQRARPLLAGRAGTRFLAGRAEPVLGLLDRETAEKGTLGAHARELEAERSTPYS
jgi:NAD(P)-dependent dehydrogenase (short-subunit alcohol dehydrogenase family)